MTDPNGIDTGSTWLYIDDNGTATRERYRIVGLTRIHVGKDSWDDGVTFEQIDHTRLGTFTRTREDFLSAFRPA